MKQKLKIGIIGAGKRVHQMYAPVLSCSDVEVVGFWNRDENKGKLLTEAFGYKRFSIEKELVEQCDALVVAVNSNAIAQVTLSLINYGKPLLVETPVWDRQIVEYAKHKNVQVAVAEQTPFLPSEQFKILLLEEKELFGIPHLVVNDNRTFEYHGIAQLRRYIGYEKRATDVCGICHSSPMMAFKDGNGVEQRGHTENWDNGQIRFESGEVAVYNFSSLYNRCGYRKPRSLRIYTDRATISNDDNSFQVLVGNEKSDLLDIKVDVVQEKDKTFSIVCNLPNKTIKWQSKNLQLNDQQEALKVVVDNFVDHVQNGTKLLYDVSQGWTDMNLLMAIRHSSAGRKYISR